MDRFLRRSVPRCRYSAEVFELLATSLCRLACDWNDRQIMRCLWGNGGSGANSVSTAALQTWPNPFLEKSNDLFNVMVTTPFTTKFHLQGGVGRDKKTRLKWINYCQILSVVKDKLALAVARAGRRRIVPVSIAVAGWQGGLECVGRV